MMNRKFLILAIIISVFSGRFVYADIGAGGDVGFYVSPDYYGYFSASFRSDESPWVFYVAFSPFDDRILGIADNWFINKKLSTHLDYFIFWGISSDCKADAFMAGTGARVGAGISWFMLGERALEFSLQGAWNPSFGIKDDDGDKCMYIRPIDFPFSTGARWWFR